MSTEKRHPATPCSLCAEQRPDGGLGWGGHAHAHALRPRPGQAPPCSQLAPGAGGQEWWETELLQLCCLYCTMP